MREEMASTLQIFDTYNELSKMRALNLQESITLELAQHRLIHGPRTPGLDRELASRGLLRARRKRSYAP